MLSQEKQLDADTVTKNDVQEEEIIETEDNSTDVVEKDGQIGIVINACYGGYGISEKGKIALSDRGVKVVSYCIKRTNKVLIELIEEGKINMSGDYSKLRVKYIDKKYFDGPGFWKISEYDGSEHIEIDERGHDLWKQQQIAKSFYIQVGQILDGDQHNNEKIQQLKSLHVKTHELIE